MQFPDIASLVPHAKPMLLVDSVITADAENLSAELLIRDDSLFCADGAVGAWVGLEYMAQTVAAHAGYLAHLEGVPIKPGMLLGTRDYRCSTSSFPSGTKLRIHVKRLFVADNGIGSYACKIDDTENELAGATLTVFNSVSPDIFADEAVS